MISPNTSSAFSTNLAPGVALWLMAIVLALPYVTCRRPGRLSRWQEN